MTPPTKVASGEPDLRGSRGDAAALAVRWSSSGLTETPRGLFCHSLRKGICYGIVGEEELDKGSQKVQSFSYRINKY